VHQRIECKDGLGVAALRLGRAAWKEEEGAMTTYSYTPLDDPLDSNGGTTSAFDINNQGQVVGFYQVSGNGGTHGFLATPVR
jgi:probable HAF family extracellular repeat protein